jgi:hypothetical protein
MIFAGAPSSPRIARMVVVSFMRLAGNVGMTGYTHHRQRALITGFSSKIRSPGHVFD